MTPAAPIRAFVAAVLLGTGLVGLVPTAAAAAPEATPPARGRLTAAAPGEVLLSVREGADARRVARRLGRATIRAVAGRPDLLVVRASDGLEAAVATAAERDPDVEWATPNPVARIAAIPNDPLFRYQWHLGARTTATAGASNWSPVNGTGVNGAGVTVAIIDTGVTANVDLDGVLPGYDFVDADADAADLHGHGTHVAGTVAQTTNNGTGAAGVAPAASILPVRVLDAAGAGTYDVIMAGLEFAVTKGARVVNLSFAGTVDAGLCDAVDRAVAKGVVVIAAAGNEGSVVSYPAACSGAIAVSAVTLSGALASYSNTGSQIDIAGPGGDGRDTNGDGYSDGVLQYSILSGRPGYYLQSGTSMASPHVAGAAALVLQVQPSGSVGLVRSALLGSAFDLGATGVDPTFGAGLLDIEAAVRAAQASPASSPPSSAPTTTTTTPAPTTTTTQPPANQPTAPSGTTVRVSGPNRYASAAAVSAAAWPAGSSEAFLATGTGYADALATGALSGVRRGPLLLTQQCELPAETWNELRRLAPTRVTIVGGDGAVCAGVAARVRDATGATVERIAGSDRYATGVSLSRAGWSGTTPVVYLASGEGFADGLGAGALAAHSTAPLLLTARCELPSVVRDEIVRLQPSQVVIVGGEGAVCPEVSDAVGRAIPGVDLQRVSGPDRFATATTAAALGWPMTADVVYVASGASFADGLAAAPAAARRNGPVLLVPFCGELPASVADAVRRLTPGTITVVGGEAAVCPDMVDRLRQARG